METEFWLNKWQKNEIGFHLPKPHPWLLTCWPKLQSAQTPCHVFVPLCGKSLDLDFFYLQGHQVTANELSEGAVKEVFSRLKLTPSIRQWHGGLCYYTDNLTLYVGDFFQLSSHEITQVEWVYDRAALIALPTEMRQTYTHKITQLCPRAQQCLITLDYAQNLMAGPPFALSEQEVQQHYQDAYAINELKSVNIIEHEPRFAKNGLPELFQRVYHLTPRPHI